MAVKNTAAVLPVLRNNWGGWFSRSPWCHRWRSRDRQRACRSSSEPRLAHRHQVGGESGQFILSRGCFLVCTCGFAQVLEWHEGRADLDPIRLQSQGAFMALPVLVTTVSARTDRTVTSQMAAMAVNCFTGGDATRIRRKRKSVYW